MRLPVLRFLALVLFLWSGLVGPCRALDPAIRLPDYNHAVWTGKEGLPAGIRAIAQTADGWLWLGTRSGLFRFDGLRFERYQGALLSSVIIELGAEDNGDLWIGYELAGASVLHADGRIEHFPTDMMRAPNTITVDSDGSVWFGCANGLFHLARGAWKKIGPADGVANAPSGRFTLDQYGALWLVADARLYRYDRARGRFVAQETEPGAAKVNRILVFSPDGRLWTGRASGLYPLPPDAGVRPLPRRESFNRHTGVGYGLFDRDGNFWTGFCPGGVCVVSGAGTMRTPLLPETMANGRLDQPWQLSSLNVELLLEDREGDIWLTTSVGLERFRENKVQSFTLPIWDGFASMAVDRAGRVWAAGSGSMMARALPLRGEPDVPELLPYTSVAVDREGNLLLAGKRAIERRARDGVTLIPLPPGPDGVVADRTTVAMFDDGRTLWADIGGVGKLGWADGKWTATERYAGLPPDASLIVQGSQGRLWYARPGGQVLAADRRHVTTRYAPALGDISGLYDDGAEVLAGGSNGLAVLRGGRFERLRADDAADLENVSGMVVGADGDHWLNGGRGLVRVRAADWRAALVHPEQALRYELIGALDGYEGGAGKGMSLFMAGDGQLWFGTTAGIAHLDPRRLTRNPVAPRVLITAVAGRVPDGAGTLRLAPGTSHFNVDFTAASLRKPERIRFRYQLVGVDRDWQDAGTRRSAYYTNVGPGAYRFRVTAVNEDGVPGVRETALAFEIAPTPTQTWWFRALVAAAALGLPLALLYLLYRYRLRQATQRAAERLGVRVAERESIARDLHDTLLQSVQGVILNVHALSMGMPAREPLRMAMENTVRQANDILAEGRDRVRELRAENSSPQALADALRAVAASHAAGTGFALEGIGAARPLHPVVQDELLAMGRECLLNAFRHAGATTVRARLDFGTREFVLEIADDGSGIAPEIVAARGREGHWGLASLYERAHKIKARLALETPAGGGTLWRVTVPAALAYRVPHTAGA